MRNTLSNLRTHLRSLCVILPLFTLVACSDGGASTADSTGTGGDPADAGTDAPVSLTLRIDPPEATAEVFLGTPPPKLAFKAFATREGEAEKEVTGEVEWTIGLVFGNKQVATLDPGGVVVPTGIGGTTKVTATLEGVSAEAPISVTLRGDVFLPGTDATTKVEFDSAPEDTDVNNAPVIEYPEDGVVMPSNLPPIEAQWTQASDNNLYRVRVTSPSALAIELFTTARELAFPADVWAKMIGSTPDKEMEIEIAALGSSKMLRKSSPRKMTAAADPIDVSAIYVWQSSTGTFRVIDVINGTDIPLPTDSPALQPGQPCSGCHRISRDGKRFAYSFNGGNFEIGTLTYDETKQAFLSKIAPNPGIRGTYATFNPLEDTTIPAMLLTVPDAVPQNTPGNTRLLMVNPETNTPLQSNIAEMIQSIDMSVGRATLMPDWSPGGDFVVFAAYNNDANYVRLLGDDIVLASLVEAPVTYVPESQSFMFGQPKVLVTAPAGADPDTGENNFLPSISPDGSAVAFTRAAGWWSIKTQQSLINLSGQIMVVRRSDGAVIELKRGSNGPGTTWSSTWPQWAPTLGNRYAWLAYASERPYGHRLTPANNNCGTLVQGQKQCKQLWITAIDRQKLAAGAEDPSFAPFWIPAQSINNQYVSPQWTRAVLPVPE